MTIDDYIKERYDIYSYDFSNNTHIISADGNVDFILSSMQQYMSELNTTSAANRIHAQLSGIKFPIMSTPIMQDIYGYKEIIIGTNNQCDPMPYSIKSLSNFYQQSISSVVLCAQLSDIFYNNQNESDSEPETNDSNASLHIINTSQIGISCNFTQGQIMTAASIQQKMHTLMRQLSNVRNVKCNLHYKITDFTGGIITYVCTVCAYPLVTVNTPNKAALEQILQYIVINIKNKNPHMNAEAVFNNFTKKCQFAEGGFSYRMFVTPYSEHIFAEPGTLSSDGKIVSLSADDNSDKVSLNCSNSSSFPYQLSIDEDICHDTPCSLIYQDQFMPSVPTFDMQDNNGSNGKFTAYIDVDATKFDIEKYVDLSEFNITKNSVISGKDVKDAIIYIFELWQKNIKTVQYDIYACHYNCHSNNFNINGSSSLPLYYSIDIIDEVHDFFGTSPRIQYFIPETYLVRYEAENKTARQTIDIDIPYMHVLDTSNLKIFKITATAKSSNSKYKQKFFGASNTIKILPFYPSSETEGSESPNDTYTETIDKLQLNYYYRQDNEIYQAQDIQLTLAVDDISKIKKIDIADLYDANKVKITLYNGKAEYTGEKQIPLLSVVEEFCYNDTSIISTLTEGVNYVVKADSGNSARNIKLKVTGKGIYTGTIKYSKSVEPTDFKINLNDIANGSDTRYAVLLKLGDKYYRSVNEKNNIILNNDKIDVFTATYSGLHGKNNMQFNGFSPEIVIIECNESVDFNNLADYEIIVDDADDEENENQYWTVTYKNADVPISHDDNIVKNWPTIAVKGKQTKKDADANGGCYGTFNFTWKIYKEQLDLQAATIKYNGNLPNYNAEYSTAVVSPKTGKLTSGNTYSLRIGNVLNAIDNSDYTYTIENISDSTVKKFEIRYHAKSSSETNKNTTYQLINSSEPIPYYVNT